MNNVILIGNLTRDPEVRYSTGASQTAICRFSIAVNDGYGEQQKTSFIPIVVFGKQAENAERFLSKGSKVCVQGRIQTGSYEKDGTKVYTTDVIASRLEYLSTGNAKGDEDSASGYAKSNNKPAASGGFSQLDDDDIPF